MEAFSLFKLILVGINLIAIILISAFAIKSSFFKIREFEKDKLTGLLNKKSFLKHLNNKIKRSNKKPLSLVALDIDDLNGENITASIGLITSYGDYNLEILLNNTDELIRSAKKDGKNIIKAIDLKTIY